MYWSSKITETRINFSGHTSIRVCLIYILQCQAPDSCEAAAVHQIGKRIGKSEQGNQSLALREVHMKPLNPPYGTIIKSDRSLRPRPDTSSSLYMCTQRRRENGTTPHGNTPFPFPLAIPPRPPPQALPPSLSVPPCPSFHPPTLCPATGKT